MNTLLRRSAITLALLGANHALAGGLWLNEYGDFAGGRANAGAAAGVDEASTILQNPASGHRIEGSQMFMAGGAFIPQVKFDVDESDPLIGDENGGQAGLPAGAASFAYVHDTGSDKWSVGIAMSGLSGAGLDYKDEWVGRYQATDVNLVILGLDPTVSYRVTDKFAVGVSAVLYYASLELKVRIPAALPPGQPDHEDGKAKLDGDDWDAGFKLGATYEFSPYTRVGMLYQSELDINFDGNLKIQSGDKEAESNTNQKMAQYVRVGLHHDLNDRLGLDFTLGWDDWSALDSIFVSVDTGGPVEEAGLEKGWKDTYHYAAGFSYKLNEDWDLTAGIAYDTNPVDSRDRTADLAVDRQVRYNAGARYELSETLTMGGYVNYADLGSAKIDSDLFSGKYSSNEVYAFSVYANWKL